MDFRTLLIALGIGGALLAPGAGKAKADGTNPTFIRNGTTETVYVWVDNGGRGLPIDNNPTKDGRSSCTVKPNVVVCATETGFFDCPTLRVYNAAGECIYVKKISYIPLVACDTNKWVWNGSDFVPDKK